MKAIILLGVAAAFLGGAAVALLISYALPDSLYVCFVATFIALLACLLACWAIMLDATRRERVTVERVVDLTVDRMLKRRGLEVVDHR